MSLKIPFQVRTSGFIQKQPYHSTPGTKDKDIMLTVFLEGKGVYRNQKGESLIEKGMIGLVPPTDTGILMSRKKEPYTHYYCRFFGAYALEMAAEIIQKKKARFFHFSGFAEIAEALREMGRKHQISTPDKMGKREALLVKALTLLNQESSDEEVQTLNQDSIREYLVENISAPVDLAKMSEQFLVSKSTLCRMSNKYFDQTIQQLHENIKIDWAKQLLKFKMLNVQEVALRVGYEDAFYFSEKSLKSIQV